MPTICRLISVGRLESVGATVGGGGSSGLEELGVSESSGAGCDSMAVPPSSSGLADASCSSDIPGQVVARESCRAWKACQLLPGPTDSSEL